MRPGKAGIRACIVRSGHATRKGRVGIRACIVRLGHATREGRVGIRACIVWLGHANREGWVGEFGYGKEASTLVVDLTWRNSSSQGRPWWSTLQNNHQMEDGHKGRRECNGRGKRRSATKADAARKAFISRLCILSCFGCSSCCRRKKRTM